MSTVRAILVLIALALFSAITVPLQQILLRLGVRGRASLPVFFHRRVARLLGLRIRVHGLPGNGRPMLVVSNHSSWLDIVVLSTLGPVSFIAKSEVGRWPVIGSFARLQRTVFVNRDRRTETGKVSNRIADRLADGDVLVLFAEGTSSTGNQILPFKTALFGAVDMALRDDRNSEEEGAGNGVAAGAHVKAYIQPLTVAYTRISGLPMGRQFRASATWYGDMDLAPHLWNVLKEGAIDVECAWGPTVIYDQSMNRKELAKQSETIVRQNMSALLTGRHGQLLLGNGDVHKPVQPQTVKKAG